MTTPLAKHSAREPVAFGAGGERTAADLLRDARRVAEHLPPSAAGSQVLLAIANDRYAFAAALLGSWLRGHAISLPPRTARDATLRLAQRPECVAVLHDTASSAALRIDDLLTHEHASDGSALETPQWPELGATFHSEADGGGMQAWPKRGSQLLGEAQALLDALGIATGLRFASTLPPCNQYGFMFGVLLPIVSGGAFQREVSSSVDDCSAQVLSSVPAHLRLATPEALSGFTHVFSSRAPLSAAVQAAARRTIIDVFGTTATGGVAHRVCPSEDAFQTLPGVTVAPNEGDRLQVTSPWNEQLTSTSCVRVLDRNHFARMGNVRAELLADMEASLTVLRGVQDAAVVSVPTHAGTEILAAVVAPSWREADLLAELTPRLTRVLCVDRLPCDYAGRHSRGSVLSLFGRNPDGRPRNFTLDLISESSSTSDTREQRSFKTHVPSDYGYFDGHFSGYPLLPGAAQLSDLILPCVRRARPTLGALQHMTRIKFVDRIRPNDHVDILLSWHADEPKVDFELRRESTLCATGKLGFHATVQP